ncbi:uncharacterized protein TNCV_4210891 [Trichonephila clavipes]|nr:uncharacterized protein TNCV_4210891 [Trichonephila clavipes]
MKKRNLRSDVMAQSTHRKSNQKPSDAHDATIKLSDTLDATAATHKFATTTISFVRLPTNSMVATRGLLVTDHVILNHGQVTWTTPELAPPLLTTTQHQREDVSALDRFNVHRCPTRWFFGGTGIELMTCLPWLDTLTTGLPQPHLVEKVTTR